MLKSFNRKLKNQKGFTLIELIVVVIIVGILASVAVPLYTGYIKRAKISEATSSVGAVKTALMAKYQKDGAFPNACGDSAAIKTDLGIVLDVTNWTYATDGDGDIAATAIAAAGANLVGGTITLTSTVNGDGSISWAWSSDGTIITSNDLP